MVLPEPVGPTSATVWPGSATKARSNTPWLGAGEAVGHALERDAAARRRPATAAPGASLHVVLGRPSSVEEGVDRGRLDEEAGRRSR